MHNATFIPSSDEVVFYPIGNTPAVNLLSYNSSNIGDNATTEILCLACGDPRSILYSLWCKGKPGVEKYNFTCCDLEPAVLARNVFLLSLMIDSAEAYPADGSESKNPKVAAIWNLCYHFSIKKEDLVLVRKHASKLLSCSTSAEEWAKSPYRAIKSVSLQTVDQLRKIWVKYAVERSLSDQTKYDTARRSEIKKTYDSTYGKDGTSNTFYAGPHWNKGRSAMNKGLRGYWKSGVAGGLDADIKALGPDRKGITNPLFAVSSFSDKFLVHFTSDPLTGFHLAEVFDADNDEDSNVKSMVALAKKQFQQWGKAFVDHVKSGSVTINLFYGDAITFCHELAAKAGVAESAPSTRLYTNQWSSKPLKFDGDGGDGLPALFDIIDTSNLADWVGLTNILLPTTQILARKSTSVLYTESFRLSTKEPHDELFESLFMNVDLFSIFLGLAPMGHILGHSIENTCGEDIIHLENPNRYRMRVSWKQVLDQYKTPETSHAERVRFDSKELSDIFFGVYLKMFELEDLEKSSRIMRSRVPPLKTKAFSRYTRLNFATLIKYSMRIVDTDWKQFFTLLLEKVEKDETLHIGKDCLLDLKLQLFMCGAYNESHKGYTYVTLVVPRTKLRVFDKLKSSPGIHLAICDDSRIHLFFSINCFFGRVKQDDNGLWSEVVEDPTGWGGSSNLIITTPVPSDLLEKDGWDVAFLVTISLHSRKYMDVLGPEMSVYMASGNDDVHVFTSNAPPGIHNSRLSATDGFVVPTITAPPSSEEDPPVVINASLSKGLVMLQAKYSIEKDTAEALALINAAFVTLTDFSPCSILLNIGDKPSCRLIFPYPIDCTKVKTRIARKSLWIEVNVPTSSALTVGGYNLDPFPVVINKNSQPISWALPNIDLSKQPIAKADDPDAWIGPCYLQFLSKREQKISSQGTSLSDFRSVLPLFKKMVFNISMQLMDTPSTSVFIVSAGGNDMNAVYDTLIIANRLRHGRETGTLILDGWVYPVTEDQKTSFMSKMPREQGKAFVFQITKEEAVIWKQIMPAAVETCRSGWTHDKNCEYLTGGKAPITLEPWGKSICSCGEGKDVKEFPAKGFVTAFKNGATRVALPWLSGVSYVEAMAPYNTGSIMEQMFAMR